MCFSFRRKYFPYHINTTPRISETIPITKSLFGPPWMYCVIPQMPNPIVSSSEATMKIKWNALRDMFYVNETGRLHRPNRKVHQAGEKENGRGHNAVDHLLFRDQVHKKTGHK